MKNEKILVINPGSTSTKIAIYEGDQQKWMESISHSLEELKEYKTIYDQLDMRTALVKECLEKHGESLDSLAAIAARGGNMPPVHAGAYEVNDYMVDFLHYRPGDQHASNLAAGIAFDIAKPLGKYTREELMKKLQRTGGLVSFFGTSDLRDVEKMIADGNEEAALVEEAMALAIAKSIAKLGPTVKGKVDQIILTGGLAYSKRLTDMIIERVSFLAPVSILPGENEMQALAEGILRVLRGEEKARILTSDEKDD